MLALRREMNMRYRFLVGSLSGSAGEISDLHFD